MKNFRGQAALEFMMTYGWAILVVLAAIGALSYFGILSPSRFTPDTCLASSGFACPGKPILGTTNLTFSIVNGMGYGLTLNSDTNNTDYTTTLNCANVYLCPQGQQCTSTTTYTIQDGAGATVFMDNCNFASVSVVKGELNLMYVNRESALTETLKVSITAKSK
ncbi:MAG: hypothetical protein ACP5NW_01790 [Candidatus Woesearchaeota archaeon]